MGITNSSLYLSIVSSIYIIIIFVVYELKDKIKSNETKLYRNLLFITIFSLIFELSIAIFKSINEVIMNICMKLFLVCCILWVSILFLYLISIISNNKIYKKVLISTIIYDIVASVLAILLDVNYIYKNGLMSYSNGPAVSFVFGGAFVFLFVMIFLIFIYFKTINKKKIIPIFLFTILMTVIALIQSSYPELLLVNYSFTLTVLLMYFTIENPDMKLVEYEKREKEKIIKAAESKSEFLSSTSHELRTPLNAIVGLSEDIQSFENVKDEIIDDTKDLINASNSLLNIINNILDSSKIESGKLDIIETDYYAKNEFESIGNIYKVRAFKKNVELDIEISNKLPKVLYGDKQRIKQVISNLLDNAVKFTDVGKINFFVDYDINTNELLFHISDTGKGFIKEEIDRFLSNDNELKIEKVFSPYGSGLGLSITKNLIRMLNGKVNAESIVMGGTKFNVSFPQKIGNEQVLINISNTSDFDYKSFDFSGKRILVVDDNLINIKVFKKAIKSLKMIVDECNNGKDAIEKIELNNNYDLIFMDIMMPVMGGQEAIKILREKPNFNTPVVALTADAVSGAIDKYKEMGFNDYLSKPFSREMVIKKIYKVIDRK